MGIGDWGLGIGDWGLGIGDWAQSPIPNPQSPIPNPQSPIHDFQLQTIINYKLNKTNYFIYINKNDLFYSNEFQKFRLYNKIKK